MILTPRDIAHYIYCPRLFKKQDSCVYRGLDVTETCLRDAIVKTEAKCLLKNSYITSRKILKTWDSIWWQTASGLGLSMEEAQNISIKAAIKFTDYCKYDIIDEFVETIATNIEVNKSVGLLNIKSSIDVIKVDLKKKTKNVTVVDFTTRPISLTDYILYINAYLIYDGAPIRYVLIDLSKRKLSVSILFFHKEQMDLIHNIIKHIEIAIKYNIIYSNNLACAGCKTECIHRNTNV